jgi:hypothetical protein
MTADDYTGPEEAEGPESEQVGTVSFAEWRAQRPFAGGVAQVLGGTFIVWPSMQFLLDARIADGGVAAPLGVVVGTLVVATGTFALARPDRATELGCVAVVLSVLSFPVAFGGLLVGMLLGGVGGVACFAWKPPTE